MSQISNLKEIITSFESAYRSTPTKLKLLDAFSVCALLTAVLQVRTRAIDRPAGPTSAAAPPPLVAAAHAACRVALNAAVPLRHPLQFVYAKLVGTFPFNSFLAGFFCCVGAFVVSGGGRQAAHGWFFCACCISGCLPCAIRQLLRVVEDLCVSPLLAHFPAQPPQLTVSLRMKVSEGGSASGPREFGGYSLAMLTLFIAAWNYVG